MMIDTHCHLNSEDYENVDEVIKNMENNIMIVSSTNIDDMKEVIDLCNKYDNIYGTIGIHPEFASTYTNSDLEVLEKYLNNPKIVGIGEIGLDYHYGKENIDKQKELFVKQILLANQYNKPIVIHSRDALEDTYDILKKYKKTKGVMHCYSGNVDYAEKLVKMDMLLGIGGVLTFKNEKQLKEVVKKLDINYFVLETDCPYLTPEPLRGKKNQPTNVKFVALKIAELKQENIGKILEITTDNACTLFDLNI